MGVGLNLPKTDRFLVVWDQTVGGEGHIDVKNFNPYPEI